MEVRTQQLVYGMMEAIATHQLLRYVHDNDTEERLRMASGATMAGLGYVFGPKLQERLQTHGDAKVNEQIKHQFVYGAAGAIAGALAGSRVGPLLRPSDTAPSLDTIAKERGGVAPNINDALASAIASAKATPDHPGGLVTIVSAGWLGYSLFFDGKTPGEQQQHLWGLGCGVIGYLWGPELLRSISTMSISTSAKDDAEAIYKRGGAAIGMILGGVIAYNKGPSWFGDDSAARSRGAP